jgi:hypothetical protein
MDKKINKQNAKPRPPRELNNYNLYMKEKVPEFKEANPNSKLSNREIFTKVANEWKKDKPTWQPTIQNNTVTEEVVEEEVQAPKPIITKKIGVKKPVKVLSHASEE